MGNSPRRTPTIPNELAPAKTALERAPTHSNDPQTWTTEPKVRGSKGAIRRREGGTTRRSVGALLRNLQKLCGQGGGAASRYAPGA